MQTVLNLIQAIASGFAAGSSALAVKWAREAVGQMRLNARNDKIQHLIDTQRDARQYLELFFKSYSPVELVPQQQAPHSSELISAIRNMSSLFKLLNDDYASNHLALLARALSDMSLITNPLGRTVITTFLNNITEKEVDQFYWDGFDVKHRTVPNDLTIKEYACDLVSGGFSHLATYQICCRILINDFVSVRIQNFLQSNPV